MFIRRSDLLFLSVFFLAAVSAWGQAARSPFSSYGLGEQYGTALAQSQGMGGVGISNPQFLYINNQNPALLVYNRLTTFQAGVIGEQRTQQNDSVTEKSGNGNLNYLAISVPVINGWWSTSFVLMPYTRLNYLLNYTKTVENSTELLAVSEQGSGGINQFYWANGVSLNPRISLGLKMAYLFSSTNDDYLQTVRNAPVFLAGAVWDRTFISDFVFTPAISIHLDSLGKKKSRLNIGLVYDMKATLDAKFNRQVGRLNTAGVLDSTTVISNLPTTVTMPGNLMVGVSYSPYPFKWMAALDASYADYTQYRHIGGENPYGPESWRIAAGFEITPDRNSLSNYLKRTTYRTGVSVENTPILANGNPVKDFGITFGVSLPVNRISSLDLAVKWGKKGDKAVNAIEENYFKIYFGITFNDQWFIKRRFD
jgi:hypothetical protein